MQNDRDIYFNKNQNEVKSKALFTRNVGVKRQNGFYDNE